MKKNQFAYENGYGSYEELIKSSKVVFKDKSTWYVTRTEYGFLAWVDKFINKPLSYFDTFDLAKQEIIDVRTLGVTL